MERQFIESLKRLYQSGVASEEKIIELYNSKKVTESEKEYILNAH